MDKAKKEQIKVILDKAQEAHRPLSVKQAVPKSYFEQGFADINKSKKISNAFESKENTRTL